MPRTSTKSRRARGHIRQRGGSYQVLVYAGVDPLTGKGHYLTESTRDEREAQKILTRLLNQVDERRNPRTRATLGAALEAWLRTHEAEETTLEGYRGYVRRTIEPALGTVPIAKITALGWRRSTPSCGAVGTGAATASRPSTTAPQWRTSAARSATGAGRGGRVPRRTATRSPAAWSSSARRTPARRCRRRRSGRSTGS